MQTKNNQEINILNSLEKVNKNYDTVLKRLAEFDGEEDALALTDEVIEKYRSAMEKLAE